MSARGGPLRGDFVVVFVLVILLCSTFGMIASHAEPKSGQATVPVKTESQPADPNYLWKNLSNLSSTAPTERSGMQAQYSPALGKVILFGGYDVSVAADDDTWEFSSDHWTNLSATSPPPGRWGGQMVYDASDGYLLLFGGRNVTQFFNDTWEYNITGWHQIPTSNAPSPRSWFGMTYDPADSDVVLFGGGMGNVPAGSDSPWSYYNDTWTYHAGVWTNVTKSSGPPPSARSTEGFAYDNSTGYVLLQGGGAATSYCGMPVYNDTWAYSSGQWTELSPATAPPLPSSGLMTFDSTTHDELLYQGSNFQPTCPTFGSNVWNFTDGTWDLALGSSSHAPQGRGDPAWVDDPAEHFVLLFGGDGVGPGYNYLNDTWAFLTDNLSASQYPSPSRESADVGQTTAFSVAVSGGYPPYTYTWFGLPSGCTESKDQALATCTFTSSAELSISMKVTDSVGVTNTTQSLTYHVLTDPSITTFSVSPNPTTVGDKITLNATASGGSGGYSFAWSGLPPGCISEDESSYSCVPTDSGIFDITATVNDTNGVSASSAAFSEEVLPSGPLVSSLFASRSSADVGQTATFTVSASGGGEPYTYEWRGLPNGCSGSNTTGIATCTFSYATNLSITAKVTDIFGRTNETDVLVFQVYSAPLVGYPSTSANPVVVGSSVTLSVTASGGTGGFTYQWNGLPTGCISSDSRTLMCVPSATGTFNVTVTVTDSNGGRTTSAVLVVTVSAKSTSSGPGVSFFASPWFLIGAAVILLAVVLAIWRFRPRKPVQSGGGPPPASPQVPT